MLPDPVTYQAPSTYFDHEYNRQTEELRLSHKCGEPITEENTGRLDVWIERNGSIVQNYTWANQSNGLPITTGDSLTIQNVKENETIFIVWTSKNWDKTNAIFKRSPQKEPKQTPPCG
jgi:hypothetical protein